MTHETGTVKVHRDGIGFYYLRCPRRRMISSTQEDEFKSASHGDYSHSKSEVSWYNTVDEPEKECYFMREF